MNRLTAAGILSDAAQGPVPPEHLALQTAYMNDQIRSVRTRRNERGARLGRALGFVPEEDPDSLVPLGQAISQVFGE